MPLLLLPAAFNHPSVVWKVKHDGFRGLAYVERRRCRLFSRAGHPFGQLDDVALAIRRALGRRRSAVADGELVVLGADGRSRFRPLLARRGPVRFYAFDLLWLDGEDLRERPLLERKAILRDLVPVSAARLLYVEHVAEDGARFLRAASALDLEGVVGKYADGVYQSGGVSTSE
jgi:bifunctional non-homologous end joining protein LigD